MRQIMELPKLFTVQSNVQETSDIFTLTLMSQDGQPCNFLPGQFNMMYLFGNGEVPISIASHPDSSDKLVHTIKAVGPVTIGMQKLKKGDTVGIRGPLGTSWPMNRKNGDVLIVGGGVALPPLRAALSLFAKNRDQYKHVTLLYGSRTPEDIVYKDELAVWKRQGIDVQVSVDKGNESWTGPVGVVTKLIAPSVYDPANTLVYICGPEIMIHFSLIELLKAQVVEENIYISMERNMQCGTGFCGHCQLGPYFICKDGPVFSYSQLKKWLAIKEL